MTRRASGFTLLEVTIAIAVTAFIGITLAMAFNTTSAAKETMEVQLGALLACWCARP